MSDANTESNSPMLIPPSFADALGFFRVWREDAALVRMEVRAPGVIAVLCVRVVAVEDDGRVDLRSDEHEEAALLRLADAVDCRFSDMRHDPQLDDKYAHTLTLFFPYAGDPSVANIVAFSELRQQE